MIGQPPSAPVSVNHVRAPWLLDLGGVVLTVRGARPQDLPGVALMHGRCSAKSLLDRYRTGGRAPAILVLDRHVRDPLCFVASTDDGRIVAMARVAPVPSEAFGTGEMSLLVEDQWQQLGVGRALLQHSAAAAALTGYRQLISYPGTTGPIVHRLLARIGATRVVVDGQRYLRTTLPQSAKLGLGRLVDDGLPSQRAASGLG